MLPEVGIWAVAAAPKEKRTKTRTTSLRINETFLCGIVNTRWSGKFLDALASEVDGTESRPSLQAINHRRHRGTQKTIIVYDRVRIARRCRWRRDSRSGWRSDNGYACNRPESARRNSLRRVCR